MGVEIEKNPIIFINGGENVNHVSSKKNNVGQMSVMSAMILN